MYPQSNARLFRLLIQLLAVFPADNGLGNRQLRQSRRLGGRGVGENENGLLDTGVTELSRLLDVGNGKPGCPLLTQQASRRYCTVTVAICLDHRHYAATGGQGRGDGMKIVTQGVEIDLRPGAFEKSLHRCISFETFRRFYYTIPGANMQLLFCGRSVILVKKYRSERYVRCRFGAGGCRCAGSDL